MKARMLAAQIALCVVGGALGASIALAGYHPAAVATAAPASTQTLDTVATLVVVRHETADGIEIAPPETMQLWEYVEKRDADNARRLVELEAAIEADLHAQDPTFHQTHEHIDGKKW